MLISKKLSEIFSGNKTASWDTPEHWNPPQKKSASNSKTEDISEVVSNFIKEHPMIAVTGIFSKNKNPPAYTANGLTILMVVMVMMTTH